MTSLRTDRPLGHKAHVSTPHLPGSRTGSADRTVNPGQAALCLEGRPGDRVVVTEKLDGSCVAMANTPHGIRALGRDGSPAEASRTPIRRSFAHWVDAKRAALEAAIPVGSWLVGEWLAVAHGTRYALPHGPLVIFGAYGAGRTAQSWDVVCGLAAAAGLTTPHVLHDAAVGLSVSDADRMLGLYGHHGATDPAEGAVWRVERAGRLILTAKFVRAEKVDGTWLPEQTGRALRPNAFAGDHALVLA